METTIQNAAFLVDLSPFSNRKHKDFSIPVAGHCRLVRDLEGRQKPGGSIDGFYPMDGTRCAKFAMDFPWQLFFFDGSDFK